MGSRICRVQIFAAPLPISPDSSDRGGWIGFAKRIVHPFIETRATIHFAEYSALLTLRPTMKSFENKTVLITGGNSGIGKATVATSAFPAHRFTSPASSLSSASPRRLRWNSPNRASDTLSLVPIDPHADKASNHHDPRARHRYEWAESPPKPKKLSHREQRTAL